MGSWLSSLLTHVDDELYYAQLEWFAVVENSIKPRSRIRGTKQSRDEAFATMFGLNALYIENGYQITKTARQKTQSLDFHLNVVTDMFKHMGYTEKQIPVILTQLCSTSNTSITDLCTQLYNAWSAYNVSSVMEQGNDPTQLMSRAKLVAKATFDAALLQALPVTPDSTALIESLVSLRTADQDVDLARQYVQQCTDKAVLPAVQTNNLVNNTSNMDEVVVDADERASVITTDNDEDVEYEDDEETTDAHLLQARSPRHYQLYAPDVRPLRDRTFVEPHRPPPQRVLVEPL